jgi:hypothetical protein
MSAGHRSVSYSPAPHVFIMLEAREIADLPGVCPDSDGLPRVAYTSTELSYEKISKITVFWLISFAEPCIL